MNEANSLIQIKGLRDGLLVSLDDAPWEEQRTALFEQVDAQPAFFQGARLALDVTSQVLHVNEMVELRDQLSERGISLWAVLSESPTTEKTAQLLGLATRISKPRPEETRQFSVENLGEETAMFLNRTLRSGTRIEFSGHVVVLGRRRRECDHLGTSARDGSCGIKGQQERCDLRTRSFANPIAHCG
jgi:septum site-determining protein MinC